MPTIDYVSPDELQSLEARVAALEVGGGGGGSPVPGLLAREVMSIGWTPDLMESMGDIPGFSTEITIPVAADLLVYGHIDVMHRKLITQTIGCAFEVTLNGSRIPGSVTGENITASRHYYAFAVHAFKQNVPAGTHTISVRGRSYSSAAPGYNGLAEVKGNYNQVIVEFRRAGS